MLRRNMVSVLFSSLPKATGVTLDQLRPPQGAMRGSPRTTQASSSAAPVADDDDKHMQISPLSASFFHRARPVQPSAPPTSVHINVNQAAPAVATGKKGGSSGNGRKKDRDGPSGGGVSGGSLLDVGATGTGGNVGRRFLSRYQGAMKIIDEFKACTPGEKYFHIQHDNFRRLIDRTLKDFSLMMEGKFEAEKLDDPTSVPNIQLKKGLQACINISKGYVKNNRFDAAFNGIYVEAVLHLHLEPRTELVAPIWMRKMKLSYDVEHVTNESSFWNLLTTNTLEGAGHVEADFTTTCGEMIKTKLTIFLKRIDEQVVGEVFQWLRAMPDGHRDHTQNINKLFICN